MEFSQKFIDIFRISSRVTTNGVKIPLVPKEDQVKYDLESHSLFRTAVGKLLWMSQLRDDIKHPVQELSRSLSNPQESDFDNIKNLLNYINQNRDFIFIMELKFQRQILKVSFPWGLSATQTQSRRNVKSHEDQLVAHWSRCSHSISRQQAGHKLQCLIHQQKQNCTLWLKQQWKHLRSSISFRNSNQRFFQEMSRSLSWGVFSKQNSGITSRHLKKIKAC